MRSLLASRLPSSTSARSRGAGSLTYLGTALGLALLAAAMLVSRHQLGTGLSEIGSAGKLPLAAAAGLLVLALAASAGAWRSALGGGLGLRQAWGCYGAGSLANTVLPARIGDGVRIALFARYLPGAGRGWRSGGACLWVATARGLVYGAICTGAVAGGLLPAWTIAVPALGLAVLAGAAACLKGRTSPPPQPRLLLAWAGLSATARVAAGVCVLAALGAPRPVTSALIGLAALGASAAVPLAPGGAGLAGAGMALALEHSGVPPATAIAAAVTFHALETLAGVAFGATGWLALRFKRSQDRSRERPVPRRYFFWASNL